ncbi:hypothetical protein M409DRAFT_49443 [Zasmidium cellare ATCC 36951]|uniref:BZIP domain-containing protein n=1 Tax=Zasmidium cellare ATCC 36951 TaxID=1080233 RepID=A0A6A6D5J9_ZASCE|nr:uncharacterized protein M409DRAFT_49443 [Zasmidium cellare ATCC 36951]KAF2172936.1 hypothetical protein M409DRAFT_49443 [Zasmidium cellare ATCC 36951]
MIYIKRETETMDDYRREHTSHSRSPDPSIPICSVTNENWRGKNDPTERRRIQNRINQRAFRQRQRAGESPKQYKPRSNSSGPNSQVDEDEQQMSSPEQESQSESHTSAPGAVRPNGVADPLTGRVWDELAQLINRNLMSAAATNAQQLGLDSAALSGARPVVTPRVSNNQLPTPLQPISLQHQVPHDPIIDIVPHPRFRYNILKAMATQQLDAAAFSAALRASGALENVQGSWLRGGLVVWSSPDQLASWELSESFVRRFGLLLQGCEDLLAATNAWRSRRGERLFASSVEGR